MKLEHVAINVSDPVAMAAWYEKNFEFTILRAVQEAPYTHFIADTSGTITLEIYNNPPDAVPQYSEMDPLLLHIAFVSTDTDSDVARLLQAGATMVKDLTLDDGTRLVMLRDPWGLAIQLCNRTTPMFKKI